MTQPSRNPVSSTVPKRSADIESPLLFTIRPLYGLYRDSIGRTGLLEPLAAAFAEAAGQGVFAMRGDARKYPRGRVAEAFADVLAPALGAACGVARGEGLLTPLRRPAQFAAGAAPHFVAEQRFVRPAARVAQPQPNEMEDFMDEDAGELLRVGGEVRVECDAAFADECAGVDRTVAVGDFAADFEANGASLHGGEVGALTRSH